MAFLLSGVSACAGLWGFDPLASDSSADAAAPDDDGLPDTSALPGADAGGDTSSSFPPPEDAASSSCGVRGQACCANAACSSGLTCWSGTCLGNVLLFGGQNATNYLGDAWEWNGTAWTPVVHGPSARGFPMASSSGGQALVFGGFFATSASAQTGVSYGDAWTWDGVNWSSAAGGPPPRNAAAMASNGAATVLFGGSGTASYLGDTWLYRAGAWSQPPDSGSVPPSRVVAAIAALGTDIYMFGGSVGNADGGFDFYDDVWKFDGSVWTNVTPTSGPLPSARASAAMAALNGKLVLYGGGNGATTFDETWEFDGATWTNAGIPGPGGRTSHAMATFGNTIVLFGGWDPSGTVKSDTWIYDGASWSNAGVSGPSARATHVMAAR